MTKVQRTFKLTRELNDDDLKRIAHIHAVYGILREVSLKHKSEVSVKIVEYAGMVMKEEFVSSRE